MHPGRGAGPSTGFRGPSSPVYVPPTPSYNQLPQDHIQGSVPTKTIYVNVPSPEVPPPLPPVAAGPPRKHYKIVFIRAPPPPPQTQHILPPRTEQKTLIYVLHQRPEEQQQRVVEVPHIPHDPQVYFVEYDTPPTAHDLQQLSSGNLDGFSVTAQHAVDNSGDYGATPLPPSDVRGNLGLGAGLHVAGDDVVRPLGTTGLYQGGDIYKRQVGEEEAEEAVDESVPRPLHT